jgi:DNA-binding transcriptional LysR family regulator
MAMDETERIERRLKLHDVRVLMSVAEAGSMHKAAERLGTSQPAVSRAIADLEHALGVRLLDRSPRGIEPTQCGLAIIRRGVAVFDELKQGIKDVEFLTDPMAGELRVGCTESLAGGPLVAVIDQLSRRYPRASFEIVTGNQPTLYGQLMERKFEVLIARIIGHLIDERMVTETLYDSPIVVAASSQNSWTRRRRVELAELVNEPWTLPPFDSFSGALVLSMFRESGLKPPRLTVTTDSHYARIGLLASGRFLTVLPLFVLTHPRNYFALKALPIKLPNARDLTATAIITLRGRALSPLAQAFIDTVRTVVKPPAPKKERASRRGRSDSKNV